MRALILAAGYATRLYPLTRNQPKPLLPIGSKPMINYIMESITALCDAQNVVVITNDKFYSHFAKWQQTYKWSIPVTILNDGTKSESDRLGAIGDIVFSIEKEGIDEDLLVIAGDNFFTYHLTDFYQFFKEKGADCVCVKRLHDEEAIRQFGVCEMDAHDKIIGFEEKPLRPKSNLVAFASYFYRRETLPLFLQYLAEGNKPDAPGNFLAWLYQVKDVYGHVMQGDSFDIGTPKAYEEVQRLFGQ